jgi:VCBS repeat-containing protein
MAAGVIAFTDQDADQHTVSVAPIAGASGYIGTLTASIGVESVSGTPGTVNWIYSVSDAAAASLAAGQSLTQTYVVSINDGHGGVTTQNVTITIHGATVTADTTAPTVTFTSDTLHASPTADTFGGTIKDNATGTVTIQLFSGNSPGTIVSGASTSVFVTGGASAVNWTISADTSLARNGHAYVQATDAHGNVAISSNKTLPAGVSGEAINLALADYSDHSGMVSLTVAGLAAGWALSEGTQNADGSWTVQTNDIGALSVTSPDGYVGALVLNVSESWTNADGTHGTATVPDNVEAFAKGSPIFASSGDDTLTASTGGHDTLVFADQIGSDVVHNFDTVHDKIDLVGFTGFSSFADVQAHLASDASGNAVITLADGETITLNGVNAAALNAGDFEFNQAPVTYNTGDMVIGDGALLPLSGVVDNTGSIRLGAAGSETDLEIIQHGVTLKGGGTVVLSDNSENVIFGSDPSVTLTNVDNIISGAGQIGDGQMTLVNEGSIIATGSNALVIDTGLNAVINSGTLESTGAGGLTVHSDLVNDGLLWANGGDLHFDGDISGTGSALISGNASLELGGSFNEQITFDDSASGTLKLDHSVDFKGILSGFGDHDSIDLGDILAATASLNYTANAAGTGGTLTVNDGVHTASIAFTGQYAASDFHIASDSGNHALVQIEHQAHQLAAAA